ARTFRPAYQDEAARTPLLLLLYLRERCFRLGEPEGHVHGAVQRDSGSQGSAGLLPLASRGVQGAETQVTVGLERAHAQLLGQGRGRLVVSFGLFGIGRTGVGVDGTKLVQRARLVPALLPLPGQIERPTRVLPGLLAASRQPTDLAEPGGPVGKTLH